MDKTEVIKIMFESIKEDNRDLARRVGMAEDVIEQQISQSEEGLKFMLSNVYDKLKSLNIINEN